MKEKIKDALKTEYQKMGLGDKALDGVALFLSKTVTKEEEIDGVIKSEDTKGLLKAFQGETDSLRNTNARLRKDFDAYKESHPDTAGKEDDSDPGEPAWARRLREQNEALTERLDRRDREEKARADAEAVIQAAKESGCSDPRALKLTGRTFSLKEGESVEDATRRFTEEYNANKKEFFSDGITPFAGSGEVNSDQELKDRFSAFARSKGLGKDKE